LPFEEHFAQYLGKENFFILYKPKDIVSGDFYFFEKVDNKLIIAAVDCTGHGVPGAFMSMIGINLLEEIIVFQKNTNPAEILTLLHKKIRFVLKQKETKNADSMDLSMVVIDKEKQLMEFSGAKNAMIYVQNKELYTLKADKMPIGGEQKEMERIFTKQTIDISQPTTIYLFSDGYQDQFGGKNKKKFMISQMRELFLSFYNIPMSAQQNILDETIENWIAEGRERQIDDILVVGVKI
jgi:serine phosphatase RsbU (regulator of sigma subunit)